MDQESSRKNDTCIQLSQTELNRIDINRQRALSLYRSKVVANDILPQCTSKNNISLSQKIDGGGGFFLDPEKSTQPENCSYLKSEEDSDSPEFLDLPKSKRRRRNLTKNAISKKSMLIGSSTKVPLPPDEEKLTCDECGRLFFESFLLQHFDCQICDICKDLHDIHSLITRSSTKDRYLLNDVDLDVRKPPLKCIFKRNPHNSSWGDMRLYLEAQVAARALEVWGSEEALERERERRLNNREQLKVKKFEKKLKDLRKRTRSSLYSKKSEPHEHNFGPEIYDEGTDMYCQTCSMCKFQISFEKL